MGREQRYEKRYRRLAARVTAKEPVSVPLKVHGQLLRWAHQSPWSEEPLYHDPNDQRVELAIRAFHDRGHRLVREEPSSMEGSVGGVTFHERAITFVFARAEDPTSSNRPPDPREAPRTELPKATMGWMRRCVARLLQIVGFSVPLGFCRLPRTVVLVGCDRPRRGRVLQQRARGRLGNDRLRHDYPVHPRGALRGQPVAERRQAMSPSVAHGDSRRRGTGLLFLLRVF
jgi:hypothetical protein